MERISLVAVDLDGTLLTSEGLPAPRGAAFLGRAARGGVHVVLATTRNADVVQALCRQLEIAGPLISTNGAQVWASPDGPLWACHTIPRQVALAIARLADRRGWELSTTIGAMTYWRQRPGKPLGLIAQNRTVVATNTDAIVGEPLRILASQPEAIEGLRSLCQVAFAGQCRTEIYYRPDGTAHSLGVFAPQADKGTALGLVLERLAVPWEHVLAIGDNPNDLPLFARAGVSVAMANAPDEVRRCASIVAPSNDDEGVAWALERFELGR